MKPRLGQLSSETTRGPSRFRRQLAEPRLHAADGAASLGNATSQPGNTACPA